MHINVVFTLLVDFSILLTPQRLFPSHMGNERDKNTE